METKFFFCPTCGNVVVKTVDSGMKVSCCGKVMEELIPSDVDALVEKHLPVLECMGEDKLLVMVGSMQHPMTEDHRIMFIYLETEHGGCLRYLEVGQPAKAVFDLCKDKLISIYAYCNIHGLWKTEIKEMRINLT